MLAAGLAITSSVQAAPLLLTSADLGKFAGATLITFDELANGVAITNQYAADYLTFSAGLHATNGIPVLGIAATNGDPGPSQDIEMNFSREMARVGFEILTKGPDKTQFIVSAYLGGVLTQTGSFVVDTKLERLFVGFEDLGDGIDRIVINAFTDANTPDAPFIINDVRLLVPEPASLGLLGLGLAGVAAARRRRASRSARG
jgi:hypothetical protein